MARELALIMNGDGSPALVGLASRPSTTAPNRIKAILALELEQDTYIQNFPDGAKQLVGGEGQAVLTDEFRIEVAA